MKESVSIFGAGGRTREIITEIKKKYRILLVVDNASQKWGDIIDCYKVEPPNKLVETRADYIVIVSSYWRQILRQLYREFGIEYAYVLVQGNETGEISSGYTFKRVCGRPLFLDMQPSQKVGAYDFRTMEGVGVRTGNDRGRVLFIAYHFPPMGASPVQRTLKFVKYLSRMGYKVTVLTATDSRYAFSDQTLIRDIPENVTVIRVPDLYKEPSELSYKEQQDILDFLCCIDRSESYVEAIKTAQEEQVLYTLPDRNVMWAIKTYRSINELVDISSFSVIYSTAPYWCPHILCYLLKMQYGVPWIADYRDPWAASTEYIDAVYPFMTPQEVVLSRDIERRILEKVDAIIVAGENWTNMFREQYAISDDRLFVISNGYDEEDFTNIEFCLSKNEKFTLCYNGLLGYNRRPEVILKAIAQLIEDGLIAKESIQWIFNGEEDEKRCREEIEAFDKYGIAIMNGMIPHQRSIEIAMQSDLMVLFGEKGSMARLNYPGKFYEYLRMGRPILCISDSDSPQAEILGKTGMGVNFGFDNHNGIKDYIRKLYVSWKNSSRMTPIYNDRIKQYSREALAKKLASIVDDLR